MTATKWMEPEGGSFVDHQTGLEYASYASFRIGQDPIPNWRNAQIRKIRDQYADAYVAYRVQEVIRLYDRQGTPACSTCACAHPHSLPEDEYQRTLSFAVRTAENPPDVDFRIFAARSAAQHAKDSLEDTLVAFFSQDGSTRRAG